MLGYKIVGDYTVAGDRTGGSTLHSIRRLDRRGVNSSRRQERRGKHSSRRQDRRGTHSSRRWLLKTL